MAAHIVEHQNFSVRLIRVVGESEHFVARFGCPSESLHDGSILGETLKCTKNNNKKSVQKLHKQGGFIRNVVITQVLLVG
ncbi:MAG: hypothetical protein ACJAYJ_004614 [Saprospiraceae bacterium]|jgi:hypothetical protein